MDANMLVYFQLGVGLLLIGALAYVILVFLLPPALGAPYVPSSNAVVEKMLQFAQGKAGERMVDLGSGDGRIVMAFARTGIEAHGYEINPVLVFASRLAIRAHGLQGKAHIHWASFRGADLTRFDIVVIYGLVGIMKSLEKRLQQDLPPGGRVISNTFSFQNWPVEKKEDKVFLYKKPA